MIDDKQLKILEAAQQANPRYFEALIDAASIVPQRASAYSGKQDPYLNFEIMTYVLSVHFMNKYGHSTDRRDTFIVFEALKFARALVSEDKDSRRDALNYNALDLGDMLREEDDDD